MKPISLISVSCITFALIAFATNRSHAGLVFTIEAPGVQNTTVAGASVETFDAVPVGNVGTYNSPFVDGVYTGGQVIPANVFGGAGGGGRYDVVGLGVTTQQTLDFNNGKTYFGMWWSAGDVNNKLEFYDVGNNLLGSYVIGDIIPFLSAGYFGNPNGGGNAGEPYVYLNFTTTGSDLIDKVVFTNLNVAGFETDNHAVFDQPITPPGAAIPEPTAALFGLALAGASTLHRRRR